MFTFTQKPMTTEQPTSANSKIVSRARFGRSPEVDSILYLQSTIRNQTVPWRLQAKPDGFGGVSDPTASGHFGHDFSRIPVHAKESAKIPSGLVVNTSGNIYEQEADRISEQVMSMPEPQQLQSAFASKGGYLKRQAEQVSQEHKRLQTSQVQASGTEQIAAPPIVHEVLTSPGQPLDPATRGFMEQRFGYDFSDVHVHTDARAAESARAVNALAYTVGQSIAFGSGQYTPGTAAGRRLLAHELTHVLQQSGGNGLRIQRQEPSKEVSVTTSTTTEAVPTTSTTSTTAPKETATLVPSTDPAKLSGKAWWDANEKIDPLNKKSSDIEDLESTFQGKVKEFKKALDDAGTSISIDTTKRPKERAYVLHYAWQVAKGNVQANAVPAMTGVDIVWDHGDDTKSKAGAQEIVTAANVASKPSLTSNHIEGKAIDWTITWTGDLKIKEKGGTDRVIKTTPLNGGDPGNTELHDVGKGYGVIKGLFSIKDPPHWSFDGK